MAGAIFEPAFFTSTMQYLLSAQREDPHRDVFEGVSLQSLHLCRPPALFNMRKSEETRPWTCLLSLYFHTVARHRLVSKYVFN